MKQFKLDLNRLKAERIAKGMDQSTFAKKIGMSRTSYWKRENGIVNISVGELARMLTILGFSQEDIPLFFTKKVPDRKQ